MFVGKNNKKVYAHDDPEWDNDWVAEYELQSPEKLLDSNNGVCWDSAELEREWFTNKKIKHKVFFLLFSKEEENRLPTHTFLAFNKDNKWYWFEHSFGAHSGIHEYDSIDDLIKDVKQKQFEHALKNDGATTEDFDSLQFYEYDTPKYGSSPEEFVEGIMENNSPINIKE